MDVKKKIKSEVDELVVTVATAYNDLITEDIPDDLIDKTVNTVAKAKDSAEENLIAIADAVVTETVLAIKEEEQKKSTRLTKLIPKGVDASPEPYEIPVAPIMPSAAKPMLEGPATPLPRDVGGVPETAGPPNIEHLVEQAQMALNSGGINMSGAAGLVDIDPTVETHHDLTTAANESRIAQGLPPKGKGPTIHITGSANVPKTEPVPAPAPVVAQPVSYAKEMHQIGKIVARYASSSNAEVAILAAAVLAIVEEATGENFTQGGSNA